MNRKILGVVAALALAAGCEFAKKTEWEGPGPACVTAGGACTENGNCCSYGCASGVCVPADVAGGVCKTTDDCGYPDYSYTQMLCKSGNCSTTALCRDNADVCDYPSQCCSHHCTGTGGTCVPNNAPVVQMGDAVQEVPRNQPWTMINTSFDPDAGDSLTYGWIITGAGGATLSSTTARNPVLTPGINLATYTVTLNVSDNWGLTSTGTVTLNVVNSPPVVAPAVATVSRERNVAYTVQMAASDANGDSLSCTWSICRAGTATCLAAPGAPAPFVALPGAPQTVSAPFPTTLAGTDEGAWEVALACSDGATTTTGTTTVTVTNTPPAITVPATRTFNLGADAASTPDASTAATATDVNGDAIASWTWSMVSVPPGSTIDTTDLGSSAFTSTATFKPDLTGLYTLDLTVCDPPASNPPYVDRLGGCSTSTVVATVYPYIRNLNHVVTDAAFYKSATPVARLVLVGPDAAAGALWDYDLVAGTAPVKTALDGAANAVALTPDGGTAVVGDNVNAYKVVLGATPTKTTWTSPVSIGDVIAVTGSDAYVFPKSQTYGVYFQHLDLNNPTASTAFTSTLRHGTWGASVAPVANATFYATDWYNGDLVRLKRQGNSEVFEASDTSYVGGKIWSTFNANPAGHVVASDGTIYGVTATVSSSTFTEIGSGMGATNLCSVDASPTESVVLAATTGSGSVRRYNSGFGLVATDAMPHWGNLGTDRGVEALFAFVSNDATKGYVVLKTTATPTEYGLYTYTIP
jgi:hypothetical protein